MAAKNPIWPPKCIKSYVLELNLLMFEAFSTGCDVQYPRQIIYGIKSNKKHLVDLQIQENPRWLPAAILEFSNPHISATGHPIHFVFGSRVKFLGLADRMPLLPVGSVSRWPPECIKSFLSVKLVIVSITAH